MKKLNLGVQYSAKKPGKKKDIQEISKISKLLGEKIPYVIRGCDLFRLCKKNVTKENEDFDDIEDFINWIKALDGMRDNSCIDEEEYWIQHPDEDLKPSDYVMILLNDDLDICQIHFSDVKPVYMYPVSENILKDHSLAKDAYNHFFHIEDEDRTTRNVEKILN